MSEETNKQRQEKELAELQSIYGDAVKDNRENVACNKWRPLDIFLTLNPLPNSDAPGVNCYITLHIKCCSLYPDTERPDLSIHEIRGLSAYNQFKLIMKLQSWVAGMQGENMILKFAQNVQQFLNEVHQPILSYEDMLKDKMGNLKIPNNEEPKVKEEVTRQCSNISSFSEGVDSTSGQENTSELVCYADAEMSPMKKLYKNRGSEVSCKCNPKKVMNFQMTQWQTNHCKKRIYIGSCLGHSSTDVMTRLAMDRETGQSLIAKKYILSRDYDFEKRNHQLIALEEDFQASCTISHASLVPYVGKKISEWRSRQCIYIFRPFILGTSLRNLKKKLNGFGDKNEALKLLRNVANGVLGALYELHSVGVLHRDIRSENVYLDDSGGVKLVGAALDSRLDDIIYNYSYCDKQTAAQDIYACGQLFLFIVSQDRTYTDVPQELPAIAKDFISRCLSQEEQWSVEKLMTHEFLLDAPDKQSAMNAEDDSGSGSEDDIAAKKIQKHLRNSSMDGHSRLNAEFEILEWLGKGGFGDVLKVKNKLDGRFYAIKRIKLNPKRVKLDSKITREVELLSRLNHANVVRYHNAWIERTTAAETEESSVSSKSPAKRPGELACVVAKLGQEVKLEWSMSASQEYRAHSSSDYEEDYDDDELESLVNTLSPEDEKSDFIQFEKNSNESHTVSAEDVDDSPQNLDCETQDSVLETRVLYIQMEFCEKRTLRQAIDSGLHQKHSRAWRLFREIVGGLAHVHSQGMIHRDLKPVNIFLDSKDHVKIGDFGLATDALSGLLLDGKLKQSEEIGCSLTGQVGTALYVAPELLQPTEKMIYKQKVDIYSLGIILFEMFHPPLETGMERIQILTDLRTKDIIMPKAFDIEENAKPIRVIRWLLEHEARLRPSCSELLSSELVPRPVPEGEFVGLLSHALSDRGARVYQQLVAACLDQRLSANDDYTYDFDIPDNSTDTLHALKDSIVQVFLRHGASEYSPPLLTPRARAWDQYPNAVKVMTASGYVCHLPYDLRLPFARHIAYSDLHSMRRYVVDRVYSEYPDQTYHPEETVECAFDIVTPKTDDVWLDAELLVVASRAAAASNLKVSIQLTHTNLIRILLQACGVPVKKHADIYPVLADISFGQINSRSHLMSLCRSRRKASLLLRLLQADVPLDKLQDLLTPDLGHYNIDLANRALNDLKTVYYIAKALGCDCPMTVAPLRTCNAKQYSGVFWHMFVTQPNGSNAKFKAFDRIATGGRYDALVEEFRKVARAEGDHKKSNVKTSSVGFSMCLERMVGILKEMKVELPASVKPIKCSVVRARGGAARGAGGLAHSLPVPHTHSLLLYLCDRDSSVVIYDVPYRIYTQAINFIKQKLNPDAPRSTKARRVAPRRVVAGRVAGRLKAGRAVAGRLVAERDVAGRLAAERDVAGRLVSERDVAGRLVAERDVAEKLVAERNVAGRLVAERDLAGRDRPDRATASKLL